MAPRRLKLACWDYDRTRPLIDGSVRPEGLEFDIAVMRPREAFTRMFESEAFDVCEVSLSTFMRLAAAGDRRFVGLPVGLSRMFRHSCLYVRAGAGIVRPEDLRSRRVGVAQLDSTGAVFIKGFLSDDHGVTPDDIQWVTGGLEKPARMDIPSQGHGAVEALDGEETLISAFAAGRIDAIMSNHIPSLFAAGDPRLVRLFPDFKAVEQDYFGRTGVFPIMHVVVMRRAVYEEDRAIATRVYEAFCRARDMAMSALYDTDALRVVLPWLIDHVEEARRILGANYWSYGVRENEQIWTTLGRYLVEQRLVSRRLTGADLFEPEIG